MKTLVFTVIAAAVAINLSGCAADPVQRDVLSTHFVPVQEHQLGDMTLSCDDLNANIAQISHDIGLIDQQIGYQENASNSFSFVSALASVSGAYAPNLRSAQLASAEGSLANAGAEIESNQSMSSKDLRVMYQARHDALMQLFYGKNCRAN